MAQARDQSGRFVRVADAAMADGLANFASGAGTTADKRTHAAYLPTYETPGQIETWYRTSWLARKLVDLPPFDMTREGRRWQVDKAAALAIAKEEKRLGVWDKLRQALIYGRLGGGVIVMGVSDSANPAMPLNPRAIRAGQLRYLAVFNRWRVGVGEMVLDPANPLFGQPGYFSLSGAGATTRIHPSRVIVFKGKPVPALSGASGDTWFWGDSEMMTARDAVQNADAAMNGYAALIEEAKLDTVTIPNLTQTLATAEGEALILRRVSIANQVKSTHNARILDGGSSKGGEAETWETRQVSWTGMPDMIRTYLSIVAGAADIPATRLLGKSPDGLNATGDSDLQNYAAMIRTRQEADLRPALDQLDAALLQSAGVTLDDQEYSFPPLVQASEKDEAATFLANVQAIKVLVSEGLVPSIALEKAVQNLLTERPWLPGIADALGELPENERFPSLSPDDGDPSAITSEGGDPASTDAGGVDGSGAARRRAANDAAARPLYVSRKVLNVAEIAAWAAKQGLPKLNDDLHVTVAFSRTPVDWIAMGADYRDADGKGGFTVGAGGPRLVEPLGNQTAVLLFASSDLAYRHMSMREAGASWDFPEYQPHVSLTDQSCDLSDVQPYRGKIVLGPEVFEDLDTGKA